MDIFISFFILVKKMPEKGEVRKSHSSHYKKDGSGHDRKTSSRQSPARVSARERDEKKGREEGTADQKAANEKSSSAREKNEKHHRDERNGKQQLNDKSRRVEDRGGKRARSRTPTDRREQSKHGAEHHGKRPRREEQQELVKKIGRMDEGKLRNPAAKSAAKMDIREPKRDTHHQQRGGIGERGRDERNRSPKRDKVQKRSKSNSPAKRKQPAGEENSDADAFANLGFDDPAFSASSNNLFGNSGFDNKGFSSTSKTRQDQARRSTWAEGSPSKPRILPPRGADAGGITKRANDPPQSNTFKIIVNELSEVSIKREEHPMKGTNKPTRRPNRGGMPFSTQRGGRGGTFGSNQQHGMGTRDGFNPMRAHQQKTGENSGGAGGGNFMQQRRVVQSQQNMRDFGKQARSASPPSAVDKSVQSSVVVVNQNPLAVPRGRNYFLHDPRDDRAAIPTDKRRLYDPRMDREQDSNPRRGGPFRGSGRGGGGYGRGTEAPIGWRNQEESNSFSRTGTTVFQRAAGRGRGGRGGWTGPAEGAGYGYGSAETSLTGRPYWRSKADEDMVWSHDKYFEEEREEAATGMKLELVDEVEGGGKEEETEEGAGEGGFDWVGTVGFGTTRDGNQDQEPKPAEPVFIDDTEEQLVYD